MWSTASSWIAAHTSIFEDSLDHLAMYASILADDSSYGDHSPALRVLAVPQWYHLAALLPHPLEALRHKGAWLTSRGLRTPAAAVGPSGPTSVVTACPGLRTTTA